MTEPDPFFGEVIFSYTREQAIADGVHVDVTEAAREVGFTIPVAMTQAAWAESVAWTEADEARHPGSGQSERGRLQDVVTMAHFGTRTHRGTDRAPLRVARVVGESDDDQPRPIDLVVHIGPGDHGEPVVTLMLPHED